MPITNRNITLILAAALLTTTDAAAQMPPHIPKPVLMRAQTSIQQILPEGQADYEQSRDAENSQVVYKGIFSWHHMEEEPSFSWMVKGMDEYKPDAAVLVQLQPLMQQYKFGIFLGTWCEDSQNLIPKLYKILQELNINWEEVMLIGMDRAKTTHTPQAQQLVKQYSVSLVPTILLLNADGTEAGRITETVQKSVEADLLAIMKGNK